MSQCEKTENKAEQNQSHAVARIEAYPASPHGCFSRNDRCNLVHADLQRGVTGREIWPPERIDDVDESEGKANARAKNHQNYCGQDPLPISCAHCPIPFRWQRFLCLLATLYLPDSTPHQLAHPQPRIL